jgi:hypothetical protein
LRLQGGERHMSSEWHFLICLPEVIKVDAGRFYRVTAAAHWSPITEVTISIADSFRLASSALDLVRVIFFDWELIEYLANQSRRIGCARKGVPGVYMKVTSFVPWIKKYLYLQN